MHKPDHDEPAPDDRRQGRATRRPGRQIRWTVAVLAGLAALIYLGFIGRGVFG